MILLQYLAENNLESLGAAAIVEMLRENATVKLLDLSGKSYIRPTVFFYEGIVDAVGILETVLPIDITPGPQQGDLLPTGG